MSAPQKGAESVLDHANAAPLASDEERSRFIKALVMWIVCGVIVIVVGVSAGFAIYHVNSKYQSYKAKVSAIQSPSSGSPEISSSQAKPPIFKPKAKLRSPETTANEIAPQAINAPPVYEPVKAENVVEPLTPAEQDFAKQLAALESKL